MERALTQTSPCYAFLRRLCAIALTSLTLLGPGVHAANPLDLAKAATPAAAAAPEIVSTGDIPARADTDERFVQDVTRRARQKDPSTQLGPRLAALDDGIDTLFRSSRQDELLALPVVHLQSLRNHWSFYGRELGKWRRALERATSPLSEDAAALAERHAVWEATRKSLDSGDVASALSNRVDGILAQIKDAERAVSGPLDAQIKLGRRANVVQAKIDAGRKVVDVAIQDYDRRLATIDAPPIWQDARHTQREIEGSDAGQRVEQTFLSEWGKANRERIGGYTLAMVALLPLLMWLAYRGRTIVSDQPATPAVSRILRRPISAWLVLVFVGVPFLFPDAPVVLVQLALLVALIPVLRLLPPSIYEVLGVWPYVVTGLYVAYRLGFLFFDEPLLYRLYLLLVTVINAGGLVWLLLSARNNPRGDITKRLRGIVRVVGWLAVAALLVSGVANVVGNVTLAEMLTGGVLDSTYIGLALIAGANVLTSVLGLLLARQSASHSQAITRHAGPVLAAAQKLVTFVALASWVIATGNEFRIARPIFRGARAVLTYPLEAGQISVTLGSILLFGIAIWIAFWVARTVRLLLRDDVLPRMALPRGVDNSISTLSYYALIIAGLMVALAAAGFETSQFAIVFGALGVGIGFGLQNIVNNFVSGLILMFERPIQPGDVVEVSGTTGTVRAIGMRATTLTTPEGADVVVPNGTLLSEKLVNWTLSNMNRRVDVEVGVAYGSDPRRVIALLREIAEGTPGIVTEPAPAIVFKGLGANSLDFGIRSWTHDFDDWVPIRTEMTARVYEALQREGIEIPFPQRDMHLRSVSDDVVARLAGVAIGRNRTDAPPTPPPPA